MFKKPETARAKAGRLRRAAKHRAAHREQLKAYAAAWYAAHKEEQCAYHRAYQVGWRITNAAEIDAYQAAYRATHKAEKCAAVAAWVAANPDKAKAQGTRHRARKHHAPINDLTADQWREIQTAHDHRCVYCHKRAKGHLTQDHITPLSKGGSHTVSNVVPACHSCNCKKNAGPVLCPVQPLLLTIAVSRPHSKKEPARA